MNVVKNISVLLLSGMIIFGVTACKKDTKKSDEGEKVASTEEQGDVLRPKGTVKSNASTISLFIENYKENDSKESNGKSSEEITKDGTSGETESDKSATGNTKEQTNETGESNQAGENSQSDENGQPGENNTQQNANPGGNVPETTEQSAIDLPYGGDPQAVKQKAESDAAENEGKFELRNAEKLRDGGDKDENKK